nr:MAG: hypothetical protein 2 [Sobelivirales sp.]UHS71483.1 MAG: hypothetical protein 2 [Sobelivirales sp.]
MPRRNKPKAKQSETKPPPPPKPEKAKAMVVSKPRPQRAIRAMPVETVCGLVDPFCAAAMGAKYPDNSPTRTLPYSYHGLSTWNMAADGSQAILWHPSYSYVPLTQAFTRTGSNVTVWSNFNALVLIANVSKYRIVSSGFIVRNILAPLNSSGMLHIRSCAVPDGTAVSVFDTLSYNVSASLDVALHNANEVTVITQHSARLPQLFNNVADDVATINWNDNGFTPMVIYVDGAPASSVAINIEYFVNYELIFDDVSGLQQLATPPPKANSMVTSATSIVTSEVSTVFHKSVGTAAKYVANKAAQALLGYFIGPAAVPVAAAALTVD